MDVLTEPLAQRRELAAADLILEVRDVTAGRLPDLSRCDGSDQIGREVPDRAAGPVDVLADAVPVVGHLDAEVVPHLRVPALRKIAERHAALDDVLLEL